MSPFSNPVYAYHRSPDQDGPTAHHPVVVVGAGPVGLAAAIDLAQHDIPVVLLDDDNTVSVGSRAICWAKRALEILDRLGCGEPVAAKGVGWNVGKVFHHNDLVFQFDLLPEHGHRRPAFVNLQQYYVESFLVDRLSALPAAEIRWLNKVVGVTPRADGASLRIDTPGGDYTLTCDWLIVADGAKSPVRTLLRPRGRGPGVPRSLPDRRHPDEVGLSAGAAVLVRPAVPPEPVGAAAPAGGRRLARGLPAGLGRRPGGGEEARAHPAAARRDAGPRGASSRSTGRASTRSSAGGCATSATAACCSPATPRTSCRRSARAAPTAASRTSTTSSGSWRWSSTGQAPDRLLESYDSERIAAADENIRNSTRSTDFITPKTAMSRTFRDAVLGLARHHGFARRLVNSGRLSVPAVLTGSPLNTPDRDRFDSALVPGAPAVDAPVAGPGSHWFLDYLGGAFTLVVFGGAIPGEDAAALRRDPVACRAVQVQPGGGGIGGNPVPQADSQVGVRDVAGLVARRYDGRPGTCYLFRPDQHVCARWRSFDLAAVRAAIARATGHA